MAEIDDPEPDPAEASGLGALGQLLVALLAVGALLLVLFGVAAVLTRLFR